MWVQGAANPAHPGAVTSAGGKGRAFSLQPYPRRVLRGHEPIPSPERPWEPWGCSQPRARH